MKYTVSVPERGVVTLHSTEDPTVWFAESQKDPSTKYRIGGVGGAAPFCTCPARTQCKHLLAVLLMTNEEQMSELPTAVGQSTAVVPRQSVTSLDARRAQNTSSQAIALAARGTVDGYREYLYIGQSLWEGKMLPDSVKTPAAAAVMMLRAAELGVPPMAAFELFYIVGNRVAIQGQMIAALIERSGKGWIEIKESTAERAVVIGHREGRPPMEVVWTVADATPAGSKPMGGWKDKLVWKAIARVGRRQFADVLGGMDVADGDGVVVDYAVVPETEGEYQRPEIAPAQEATRYGWTGDYNDALQESPCSNRDVADFFEAQSKGHLASKIDEWLNTAPPTTARALIKVVADWIASGRPEKRPTRFVVTPPSVGGEPEPATAPETFDEAEWSDPSAEPVLFAMPAPEPQRASPGRHG